VITEEGQKDNDAVAADLMAYDIPVVWQDERWFTAQHNKGIIVDGRMVLISSINYSDGSITANREAGVIILHEGIAQWYQEIYDFDWGLGDCDVMEEVNIYWEPNIPMDDEIINVTVYTQKLYSDVTEVILGVKIAEGGWINHTITANVFPSVEGQYENYYFEIAAQPNFTNISVQAFVEALGVWHTGVEMQIRVLNEIDYTFTIDSPEDMEYEAGSIGHSITWSPISYKAHSYEVYRNGTEVASGNWNGSLIIVSIDGLSANLYNFTLNVTDTEGLSRYDTVYVRTHPSIDPTITAPTDMGYEYGSSGHFLEWEPYDLFPSMYQVYRNEAIHLSGSWNGSNIVVQVDGLDIATFNYTLAVFDDSGNSAKSTVWVTVVDTTSPTIDHPSDFEVELGTSYNSIRWSPGDLLPSYYVLFRNGAGLYSGSWTGSSITINIDGLTLGIFNYTMQVSDTSGNTANDTVSVTVVDTTSPSINGPTTTDYLYGSTGNSIIWAAWDILPMSYQILKDGSVIDSGSWYGLGITVSIDGLEPGEYNFTAVVTDTSGNTATHTTIVTVTQPLDVLGMLLDNWAILVTAVSVLAIVILGSRVYQSKR
jgi:FlaG/FlaF family flagellin (archaellin)